MKNRKAQVDPSKILVFIVVVALSVGYVYAINKNANELATETIYRDDLSSVSLISDAVINSPSCLLYTETSQIAPIIGALPSEQGGASDSQEETERTVVSARRGIIDWSKVSDSAKGCVNKGPYVWNAVVNNLDNNLKKEIKGYNKDNCKEIGKRSSPVVIKNFENYEKGKVDVSIASMDALATINRNANTFEVKLINVGSCKSEFAFGVSIVNATSGEKSAFKVIKNKVAVEKYVTTTKRLDASKDQTIKFDVPDQNLNGYSLIIEVTPKELSSYVKIYKEAL